MLAQLTSILGGVALYGLLCGLSVLTGRGLLRALGVLTEERAGLLLSPVVTLLVWTLSLGAAAGLGLPIRFLAPVLWGLSLLLAVNGLVGLPGALRRNGLYLALCLLLPVATMWAIFAAGLTQYLGTVTYDGGGYIATGLYYWGHARSGPSQLSPIVEYGHCHQGCRCVSYTLLALLSPLGGGDTRAVAALYQAWTLFMLSGAVLLFWLTAARQRAWPAVTATTLTLLGGWITDLVWCNAFDNGLALIYMPTLAVIPALYGPRTRARWLFLGALMAGVAATYPEAAVLIVAGAALVTLPWLWRERLDWPCWVRGLGAALLLALLLLLPDVEHLVNFVQGQFATVTAAQRPGGTCFAELLELERQPEAFWALGGESFARPPVPTLHPWALLLTALLPLGLFAWVRRGQWGLTLCTLFLGTGTLYLLICQHYGYGSFKLITLNWWCLIGGVVAGGQWLVSRVPGRLVQQALAGTATLAAVLLLCATHSVGRPILDSAYLTRSARDFRVVRQVPHVADRAGFLVAVDDVVANYLALYYLRDTPYYLLSQRGNLAVAWAGVGGPWMAPAGLRGSRYVLSDDQPRSIALLSGCGRPVWARGPFRLWDLSGGSEDTAVFWVENPNLLESLNGQPFFWIGAGDTAVYVWAARPGTVALTAEYLPGPSIPEHRQRRLAVVSDAGQVCHEAVPDGAGSLRVPVEAGVNRILLRPLDQPTLAVLPNGDTRPLLVGVQGLKAQWRPD